MVSVKKNNTGIKSYITFEIWWYLALASHVMLIRNSLFHNTQNNNWPFSGQIFFCALLVWNISNNAFPHFKSMQVSVCVCVCEREIPVGTRHWECLIHICWVRISVKPDENRRAHVPKALPTAPLTLEDSHRTAIAANTHTHTHTHMNEGEVLKSD